jgi:uncharacterized protein (TIGR02996 family)
LRSNARRTADAYGKALTGDNVLAQSERPIVAALGLTVAAEVARAGAERKGALANDEALVNDIAAHFDDDAPRLVYADLLSERDDVRGPYITMAVQQARGEAQLKGKLEAYEKKHRNALLGPLKPVVVSYSLKLARGFIDHVAVQDRGVPWDDTATIAAMVGDLRWATLRALTIPSSHNPRAAVILEQAPLRSLRLLRELDLAALGKLVAREDTFPVERIEGLVLENDGHGGVKPISAELIARLARAHERLPALRTLHLWGFEVPPEPLLRLPFVQRLAELSGGAETWGGRVPLGAWVQRLKSIPWAVPTLTMRGCWVKLTVETIDGALARLTIELIPAYFRSSWNEFAGFVDELKAIPAGLVPTVQVKLPPPENEPERAAAKAALAHLGPTEI